MSNKPNIETAKTSQVAEVREQLDTRREVLIESYAREKDSIYEHIKILTDLRYPTEAQTQRLEDLDQQLKNINQQKKETLKDSKMELVARKEPFTPRVKRNPPQNNHK